MRRDMAKSPFPFCMPANLDDLPGSRPTIASGYVLGFALRT